MNSLSFYIKNVLTFDILNKFNIKLKKKLDLNKLVISTTLTNDNFKSTIQKLLALEILFLKHSYYLTIKNGNYIWIKMDIQNKKNITLFLLKYIWIFYPKLIKNLSVTNNMKNILKKKNVKFKSLFCFKLAIIKELEIRVPQFCSN